MREHCTQMPCAGTAANKSGHTLERVEDAVGKSTGGTADEAFTEWAVWAVRQADRLDPLAPRAYCSRTPPRRRDWYGSL